MDLPASAVDALKGHRHLRGPFVFCQENGQPLTDGLMKLPLQPALRQAGISREQGRIGWHYLRHTYGSHLAMRGVPLKVIQELMGHATIEMTMRYAHLAPEVRESAVQQLDRPVAPTPRRTGQRRRKGTLRAHEEPGAKENPSNPSRLLGFPGCPRWNSNPYVLTRPAGTPGPPGRGSAVHARRVSPRTGR